ncbi:MAG: MlaD family protein [Zymomonas mobilis subsp. pomaceae]|uniref:Mammalian cell entry related domain protein n=1 Tax=Zymomonas mobilis subsp. pomaceae (strain ATCC 29192 / DSM 22645 / JCM 10191 / CCUG 17912 / NBRC 13757 / NCIMB 11200 / NRRL B-4491 / Barker I) TaxID=579138 RepID=F8EUE9_ZYMMT|nr:MlaD family protein [Zymomonas mobilis]AEI37165.1 Mammalian cell entry related domain protein [Zymomonas mobilis subsp. pomaceae ATCC 29192]MDX5948535.1 MlaD family protein [Zymomonas mobilis subsp. pomaceae]GEB89843.1 hypothetical protein ZMO02_14800 [Zymomonas mobilis subsp. pomaceae]
METRSNYILVGSVTLLLLALIAAVLIWVGRISGNETRLYDIFFHQSVDGLTKGSTVTYSGVPSGQVKEIKLLPKDPDFVRVRIILNADTPVLQGTTATMSSVGFTGVNQITLAGGVAGAKPIENQGPFGVPVIPTKPGALGQILNSAPQLLERITTLTERMSDLLNDHNQRSIARILDNMNTLSATMAGQSPKIRQILDDTHHALVNLGDAGHQIADLAQTTNDTVKQDIHPATAHLKETVMAARDSMQNLNAMLIDARPGVHHFSNETMPQFDQLINDLHDMIGNMSALTDRLNQNGAEGMIRGRPLPDYKPKD